MSRNQLVTALCDIYGYSRTNLSGRPFMELWEDLDSQEQHAVKEYAMAEELCA